MRKQTTRQRVEQAVEKVTGSGDPEELLNAQEAVKLILAERRRIARQVMKAYTHEPNFRGGMVPCEEGKWVRLGDILARLRG